MAAELRPIPTDARKAAEELLALKLHTARAEGQEAGRNEWRPYIATAIEEAAAAARRAQEALLTKLEAHHAQQERKALRHGRWMGLAWGAAGGVLLGVLVTLYAGDRLQNAAFDAATRATAQGVAIGSVERRAGAAD